MFKIPKNILLGSEHMQVWF